MYASVKPALDHAERLTESSGRAFRIVKVGPATFTVVDEEAWGTRRAELLRIADETAPKSLPPTANFREQTRDRGRFRPVGSGGFRARVIRPEAEYDVGMGTS